MTTVGLLLAAGAGRRMGGPKALVRPTPDGPTLLETALHRLRAAGLERVVVVLGAEVETASSIVRRAGAEVVVADDWDEGMGASLRAGLAHLESTSADDVEAALVTLVDLPDVGPEVHRRVLDAAGESAAGRLVRATYQGRPGHPVLLGRGHWPGVVRSARGDRGARAHLASHDTVPVECGDLASGADVDVRADLQVRFETPGGNGREWGHGLS